MSFPGSMTETLSLSWPDVREAVPVNSLGLCLDAVSSKPTPAVTPADLMSLMGLAKTAAVPNVVAGNEKAREVQMA